MRAQTGEFLAEGPQAVREALVVPGVVLEVFATAKYDHWRVDGVLWSQASEGELAEIADAVTPQGIVARCASVLQPLSTLPADLHLVAVAVGVRDPGNAGSLVRAADAAGADAVVFAGDTVDPLNPKAVRATVGSLFHLPVVIEPDVPTVLEALRQRGIQLLAADGGGERSLFQLELGIPTAWLFGNEAHGMSPDVLQGADERVAIPISGRA